MKDKSTPLLQNQNILLQVVFLGLLLVNFHHPQKLLIVTWNSLIIVRENQLEIEISKELIYHYLRLEFKFFTSSAKEVIEDPNSS